MWVNLFSIFIQIDFYHYFIYTISKIRTLFPSCSILTSLSLLVTIPIHQENHFLQLQHHLSKPRVELSSSGVAFANLGHFIAPTRPATKTTKTIPRQLLVTFLKAKRRPSSLRCVGVGVGTVIIIIIIVIVSAELPGHSIHAFAVRWNWIRSLGTLGVYFYIITTVLRKSWWELHMCDARHRLVNL